MSADYEWQLQAAFLAVLKASPALASTPAKPWTQADADAVYPCLVVHCSGVPELPEGAPLFEAFVELGAKTHTRADPTGQTAAGLLGDIRAAALAPGLAALNAQLSGCKVLATCTGQTSDGVDENIRTRSLTVHCTLQG